MLLQLKNRNGQKGFTLVELLIVVAIIGVLSTIGVPTFRRMIQKSKKSEAKVNLGAIYTTEAAFQSEYNAFGNNLSRMGFEMEGADPLTGVNRSAIYKAGFMVPACTDVVVSNATIQPTGGPQPAINAQFPNYYVFAAANTFSAVGRSDAALAAAPPLPAVPAMTNCFVAANVPANAGPAGSVGVGAGVANVATDGLAFTAIASGIVMSDSVVGATAAGKDIWTITQDRILANRQDGIR